MKEQKNSLLENILGWLIGLPIILALLILFSPVILYFVIVKGPILSYHKKVFLKRNAGKQLLCISSGRKFQIFHSQYRQEVLSLGIDDIVSFDPTKSSNQYDGFEWDTMISRHHGFPILVRIEDNTISQQSLKEEFKRYFKKEIDLLQLKGCIKTKVDGKNY